MAVQDRDQTTGIKVLVASTYLLMVVVNALANTLPINGVVTGDVSDAYPNLFAPAPYTFAIWGLIYLLLAGHVLYQLGVFRSGDDADREALLRRVGVLFAISSLANAGWIFAWHYDAIPLSMLLMVVILACLIAIALTIRERRLTGRDALLIRLPFSVYLGWITVATIANATTLLVYAGWNGFGISEVVWTVLVLLVGLAIALATAWRLRDAAYGLTVAWAYVGILAKHTSATGFAGQFPAIIVTVIVSIVALLAASVYLLISRREAALAR